MPQPVRTQRVPLYIQIREALRTEISAGRLQRGQQIPSESTLVARFGASRMTVRQSIEDLVDEGLLYRRHGVGTFVAFPRLQRDQTRLTSFFDRAEAGRVQVQVRLLSRTVIKASSKVAAALDIPAGGQVVRLKTLRCLDGMPVTLHDTYIPFQLLTNGVNEDQEVEDLWTLFSREGYPVKRAIQKVEARQVPKEVARLMSMEPGLPVLFKERTVYAQDGTPVEFTYCYNRGDMYSLTVALER